MKPKLIVDSISLLSSLTGIGRYTYEISKYLKSQNEFELNFFYGYPSKKLLEPSDKSEVKNLKSVITKIPLVKKIARKLISTLSKLFTQTYDIYWQPNFIPTSGIKSRKIITSIHDFSAILYKGFHSKELIEHFENNFYKNIYRSDIIITGSIFTKKEILERLDFEEEQVKVVYHGIDHSLFKVYDDLSVSFKLPKNFILSVGSIEPRKNLLGLLKAYDSLDKDTKNEYKLVLAGFKGWENKEIMDIINSNKTNITYLGFISDIELAKVYNLASLFVYPSFYEGFGLPPLEAMACGTPVVCSDSSSLPEVGGDAVMYCDPYDINDIKVKIELVLSNEDLQKELITKGISRAKLFTWEKSAKEHLAIFEEVLES